MTVYVGARSKFPMRSLPWLSSCTQERFFEKPIILADRNFVEKHAEAMIDAAKTENVVCLVVGDPLWWVHIALNFRVLADTSFKRQLSFEH